MQGMSGSDAKELGLVGIRKVGALRERWKHFTRARESLLDHKLARSVGGVTAPALLHPPLFAE
jgi:hypothetical protein